MQLRSTDAFTDWVTHLRDQSARSMIARRLARLEQGNPGNTRSVGAGVVELKIDFGPGYRVYYIRRGKTLILLLCGGDKSSQARDIERAKELARTEV